MRRRSCNVFRSRGFTLLEILIAMSIFSLIGIASTALLSSVIDSNSLSDERFAQLEKLQRGMLIIERDLLQAIARPIRVDGDINENVMSGGVTSGSDADGIGFVRSGWHNPQFMLPRSNMQYVAYRLKDDTVERLYGNYVDNVIGFEPKVRTLIEGVEDFQVEFFVKDSGAPEDERDWNESYQGTVLPRAVAIIITTEAFGEIRREFITSGGQSE
ncbi:type II secretion system minor pseudopilin GspJ [Alteromonas oceanisediminis]|uniref:type II secretion system minor pseudopilin GspJ n=1 Tax=Alteromonas oceanisediminis TaxID=2836180 RepID=UPI001BDA0533|nr:type II secretion system minor pseudopilin GspJ [Alteromonas oceanisediminis]MBT0587858.1 type II secretion system minor pseudopilin GspJ [Alteromonas oceanisediminis]